MILIKDNVSNLLSIINNTIINNKNEMILLSSKTTLNIISLLYNEGFISSYKIINLNGLNWIYAILNKKDGRFIIHNIKRISKPSQKKYYSIAKLKNIYSFTNGDTCLLYTSPSPRDA
jgi:small subunit ribosomal protein S8